MMGEVYFYHLTRSPIEAVLPALLEKSLARGWRVALRGTDRARLEWLDEKLWLVPEDGFLPHALAGGGHDAAQPVLLTTAAETANDPQALIAIDAAQIGADEAGRLARASLVFDGADAAALADARAQWTRLAETGLPLRYWSEEAGRWTEKASRNTDGGT